MKANGTDAKSIALHFVETTTQKATRQIMSKTILQAKSLLEAGYTLEEIKEVIDFVVNVKHVNMYSLGYVGASINDVLREIKEKKSVEDNKAKSEEIQRQLTSIQEEQRNEVKDSGESTQRNRTKLDRFGTQSRFGEKFDFDMFEGK